MSYSNCTKIVCSNCGKTLKRGEKEVAESHASSECAECSFHAANGTRTIEKYNKWLKDEK